MSIHLPSTGSRRPVTTRSLVQFKRKGKKIAAVTCYDYISAKLVEAANLDVILVGDSLGNVVQGHDSTLPVTVDDIIYHARAVRRGIKRAHLVGDMPFMSYQVSPEEALRNAGRLMAEGHVHSVKLEGGGEIVETVRRIVRSGIPVMGHLGLTPQSVHQLGGYRVQGRDDESAQRIFEDAVALEEAGAYAVVLECVPERLARDISERLFIPTIGIGAGPHCDGQILVLQDLLGLNLEFRPKFVRPFAELGNAAIEAMQQYGAEVRSGTFPSSAESFDPEPHLQRIGPPAAHNQ